MKQDSWKRIAPCLLLATSGCLADGNSGQSNPDSGTAGMAGTTTGGTANGGTPNDMPVTTAGQGGTAGTAGAAAGVECFERTDREFVVVGSVDIPSAQTVTLNGSYAYVSVDTDDQLGHVVDVSEPTSPSDLGTVPGFGLAPAMAVVDGQLFTPYDTFSIYDLSDPASPALSEQVNITTAGMTYTTMWNVGDFLYGTWGGDLRVMSTAREDLGQVAVVDAPGSGAAELTFYGDYVYVADGERTGGTFNIFDASDPAAPVFVATVAPPELQGNEVRAIEAIGSTLYVGKNYGMAAFSLSDPLAPSFIAETEGEGATPLRIRACGDGLVCRLDGNDYLAVFDVTSMPPCRVADPLYFIFFDFGPTDFSVGDDGRLYVIGDDALHVVEIREE